MAGPQHGVNAVNLDPALMKWYRMNKNRYKYFKWTPKTARVTVLFTLLIPSAFFYLGYTTEGKYDFKNKRRGDTLAEW